MIKSSKDTRYAKDSVVTHDGMKFPCWALPDLSSFGQKFGVEDYEKVILELKSVNVYWVLLFFLFFGYNRVLTCCLFVCFVLKIHFIRGFE